MTCSRWSSDDGLDIEERLKAGVLTLERAAIERKQRKAQRTALVAYLKRKRLLEDESSVEEIYRGVLAVLGGSKADRALINLEDTWLEMLPQNIPAMISTQQGTGNWRKNIPLTELLGALDLHGIQHVRSDSTGATVTVSFWPGLRRLAESTVRNASTSSFWLTTVVPTALVAVSRRVYVPRDT